MNNMYTTATPHTTALAWGAARKLKELEVFIPEEEGHQPASRHLQVGSGQEASDSSGDTS